MNKIRIVAAGLLAGLAVNLGEMVFSKLWMRGEGDVDYCALHIHLSNLEKVAILDPGGFIAGIAGIVILGALRTQPMSRWASVILAGLCIWVVAGLLTVLIPLVSGTQDWFGSWHEIVWTFFELPIAIFIGSLILPRENSVPATRRSARAHT